MYRIVVCDDEKNVCAQLENYILQYLKTHYIQGEVEVFFTGEVLSDYLKQSKKVDLIFLDIELPKRNGVEVGRFLREELKDEQTDIIYISSKTSYAMELFKCRPLDFLIKPIEYSEVESIMDVVVKRNKIRHQSFSLQIGKNNYILPLLDILYFRSENKKIHIVMLSGEDLVFTEKLDDIESMLPPTCFLRIHKSFLVNCQYVTQYCAESVKMVNGDVMNISKSYRAEVKQKLMYQQFEGYEEEKWKIL